MISHQRALDYLLADAHWWLWSVETQREVMRLLVALVPRLDVSSMGKLEQAILQGPPPEMFKNDIESDQWKRISDHEVWLRLAKAQAAGASFGQVAKGKLDELTQQYQEWQLAPDESDEFPFWMGTGDELRKFVATPQRRRKLVEWLKQPPSADHWQEDDWRQRCRDDFPTTACALLALAHEGEWPAARWREAIQAWAEEKLLRRSWRYMAQVITNAPDDLIQAVDHSLGWWLQSQAKAFVGQDALFFLLARRLLGLKYEDRNQENDDAVTDALNHPVGHAAEALLRWWYRQAPKDAEGLRHDVKALFTKLCDTQIKKYRHGRVLLAAHTIALFRVDEGWTRTHLLPLFDWQKSEVEARAAWEGFLWSPRLYRPLLTAIKKPLLATATRYALLGKHPEQYAAFLTFAALDPGEIFTPKELADATRALPPEGLDGAAQALVRALEGAGEQRGEYWRNRVLPYFTSIWPKSRDVITPAISESLARLCVAAREAFPDALELLRHWLQPVEHPDYPVHLLFEAELCVQFPVDALVFLSSVIGDDAQWLPRKLQQCLDKIQRANPALANDRRFIRLNDLLRR